MTGDGLVAPANAPTGQQTPVGVQPGSPGLVLARLVVLFGSSAGLFLYSGVPGLGNPPVVSITEASTDPFGNAVVPGLDVTAGAISGTTISGSTFLGVDLIINSSGIFLYSGTPALGNLVGSWAVAAGTDAFTNPYPKGLAIGNPSSSTPQIQLIPAAGGPTTPAVLQFTLFPTSFFGNQPNLQAFSPSSTGQLIISGPGLAQAGFKDFVQEVFSTFAGAVPAAYQVNYVHIDGVTLSTYVNVSASGVTIPAGSINAIDPTTGTAATPAISEGWHAITLDANWSTLAGQPHPSYRFLADAGRKIVELCGAAQFNVNIANTNLNGGNPLPAVYRPLTSIFLAGAPGSAGANILTTGVIVAAQGGLATPFCNFNGIYPVDL